MARLITVYPISTHTPVIKIGRGKEFDICLYDPTVSRQGHAEIACREDGAYGLVDRGTTNGTRLNGERLEGEHVLVDGDVIQCGDSVFVFEGTQGGTGPATALEEKTHSPSRMRSLDDLMHDYERVLVELEKVRVESRELRGRLRQENTLVGSLAVEPFTQTVQRAALSDRTVLVRGDNGTGKELVSQALHQQSRRSHAPFLTVNCAAISDTMLESELFGHRKGAFTGAQDDRLGKFRAAEGGTLFLDEVGDLSSEAQAKVLRAIEYHEIQPLGEDQTCQVDVRIVAATNKDLGELAGKGKFRQDLYQRLRVVELSIPSLKERKEDIGPLATHFLAKLSQEFPTSVKSISPDVIRAMENYKWPGNVRELRNVIERAVIFCRGEVLELDDFGADLTAEDLPTPDGETDKLAQIIEGTEARHIRRIYNDLQKNKRQVAKALDITRQTLDNKLAKYGIS